MGQSGQYRHLLFIKPDLPVLGKVEVLFYFFLPIFFDLKDYLRLVMPQEASLWNIISLILFIFKTYLKNETAGNRTRYPQFSPLHSKPAFPPPFLPFGKFFVHDIENLGVGLLSTQKSRALASKSESNTYRSPFTSTAQSRSKFVSAI